MSIINVFAAPLQIVVAVDTIGDGGAAGRISKAAYLPALHALVAARGSLGCFVAVCTALMAPQVAGIEDFDGIAPWLAERLPQVRRQERRSGRAALGAEIVLAGWSPREQVMQAWLFGEGAGFKPELIAEPGDRAFALLPGDPSLREAAEGWPVRRGPLRALMQAQVRTINAREGARVTGGNGVMFDMTPDLCEAAQLGDLGTPDPPPPVPSDLLHAAALRDLGAAA